MATYWSLASCTSLNQNFRLGTMLYPPGRIRPGCKIAYKWHKKQMLSLIWLHTGSLASCTSLNQNFRLGTMLYLPGRIRPGSKKVNKWHKKASAEPDMATYWFNSMQYKSVIRN